MYRVPIGAHCPAGQEVKVELWDRDGVPLRYANLPIERGERVVKIPIRSRLTASAFDSGDAIPDHAPFHDATYLRVNPGRAGVPIFREQV